MKNKTETEIERRYYPNGQLNCELPTVNGKKHGIQRWWYDNGNKLSQYTVANGLDSGICIHWMYKMDVIEQIYQYKNGNNHGCRTILKYRKELL